MPNKSQNSILAYETKKVFERKKKKNSNSKMAPKKIQILKQIKEKFKKT